MKKAKILLVEDDQGFGSLLMENLQLEGYFVIWVQDGNQALRTMQLSDWDLILLDIMLPNLDGLSLLTQLRKTSDTPVIILSAKGSLEDRLQGLEKQCDDYLPKPFHLKELILRIEALLRRSVPRRESPMMDEVSLGKANFSFRSMEVRLKDNVYRLNEKEALLLQFLLAHEGEVISRERIVESIWGYQSFPSTRTVDNFIVQLRKWIEEEPAKPKMILSHRGIGYSLRRSGKSEDGVENV